MMMPPPASAWGSPSLTQAELQLGFVVRDLDAAIRQWTALLGIGPWIVLDSFAGYERVHRGQVVDVEMVGAFCYHGDVQFEVISQLNSVPTPYQEFLATGREGLQHLGFYTEDYDGATRAMLGAGLAPVYLSGPKGSARMTTYYEEPGTLSPMLEIIELSPQRHAFNDAIRRRCQSWDGQELTVRIHSVADILGE